jgi:hypothetical protein
MGCNQWQDHLLPLMSVSMIHPQREAILDYRLMSYYDMDRGEEECSEMAALSCQHFVVTFAIGDCNCQSVSLLLLPFDDDYAIKMLSL